MAKKLIKSEKLQRQVEQLDKRFEDRSEEPMEQANQDATRSATQTERKPTDPYDLSLTTCRTGCFATVSSYFAHFG